MKRLWTTTVAGLCCYELAGIAGWWPTLSAHARRLDHPQRLGLVAAVAGALILDWFADDPSN